MCFGDIVISLVSLSNLDLTGFSVSLGCIWNGSYKGSHMVAVSRRRVNKLLWWMGFWVVIAFLVLKPTNVLDTFDKKILCQFSLMYFEIRNSYHTMVSTKWQIFYQCFIFFDFRHACQKYQNTKSFLVRILLFSVRIQKNTDQKNLCIWTLFTQCKSPYSVRI